MTSAAIMPIAETRPEGSLFWARALSPDEWAELPHQICDGAEDCAVAQLLLAKWRKVIVARSGSDAAFQKRLETLGINEEEAWRRLLPRKLTGNVAKPEWALLLETAMGIEAEECREAIRFAGEPTAEEIACFELEKYPAPQFPQLLAPFLAVFLRNASLSPTCAAALTRKLLRSLSRVCARTVAYELRQARGRGDFAAADYDCFCNTQLGSAAGRTRLFEQYPVLARVLADGCVRAIEVTVEVISRLENDRDVIAAKLNGGVDPGLLTLCLAGVSDSHSGGRSAWILSFDSGFQLVYKPRSHSADAAWANLIDWFNKKEACLPLRAATVVERDGYGWSEFIAGSDCVSEEEVGRYYQRQGTQAAVVWLLGGQDFHADNFVAAGEYPVAVDLEGLLAPSITIPMDDLSGLPQSLHPLQFTLAGTLMLPYWRAGDRDRLLFQSSGIGGSGVRSWPIKQPKFADVGTESMRIEYLYPKFEFDCSVPKMARQRMAVVPFLDSLKQGFVEGYRAILTYRQELRNDDGPLKQFRELETRLLFRDTQDYANLLFWITAPDLLTSGAARDIAIESLAGDVPVFFNGNSWPDVVDEEKKSLWQGDIPIAYSHPMSTGIRFSGGKTFGPVTPLNSYEQMRRRLEMASLTDCAWQEAIIEAQFRLAEVGDRSPGMTGKTVDDASSLMMVAREIADDLVITAVRQECGVSWLSFVRSGGRSRVHALQGELWSLNGTAGNALFLANMAAATGDPRYAELAREGLACAAGTLDQIIESRWVSKIGVSGYLGSFALVYALAASARQLQADALLAQAVTLALRFTPEQLRQEKNPDFLVGVSGAIAILAWLHGITHDSRLLEAAQILAETVRATAVDGGRKGWQVAAFQRPLLGIAHGSAGIAMALLRLYRECGDEGNEWMFEMACAGLEHERDHFHMPDGQWPNLQEADGRISFMSGWCAGAAGIGLSRIAMQRDLPNDAVIKDEIAAAVKATLGQMGGYQHHACCGEAGRIQFLQAAGLTSQASEAALGMVENFRTLGYWRLQEFSESLPIPGLLAGVAGVGLTLLSVSYPNCSEVLTLS